jgi:hypothetical protein
VLYAKCLDVRGLRQTDWSLCAANVDEIEAAAASPL